jgi:hypothetical protein
LPVGARFIAPLFYWSGIYNLKLSIRQYLAKNCSAIGSKIKYKIVYRIILDMIMNSAGG